MKSSGQAEPIAERGGIAVHPLDGAAELERARFFLDAAESSIAVPMVDESERARIETGARAGTSHPPGWQPLLALHAGEVAGYAGVLLPHEQGGEAIADVAVAPGRSDRQEVLALMLETLEILARRHGVGRLEAWTRNAADTDAATAAAAGFGIERRLGVLGRDLDAVAPVPPPAGIEIRPYRPGTDDRAVVEVLAQAYAGTANAGWSLEQLRERRAYDWFRAEDLLLAVRADGSPAGLHWTKRRDADSGEVYNLAVHPRAQGSGLGRALLTAGLAHLATVGCREVLLWVDLANEPAVRLYTAHGFDTRWQDFALGRRLAG